MPDKVFIKNNKGLKLAAIVERPEKKGKFPGVILLHGFKGYKEEDTYTDIAERLLKMGIVSIRFDASGFGESEGDFEKDYRFSNYINDAEAVYKSFTKKSYVNVKRIGVVGQSMGGTLALIFSANHPEIKAVVSVSPPDIFAIRGDLGKRLEEWKHKGYLEIESSKAGTLKVPYDYAQDAMKYDTRKYSGSIKAPKLFILGLNDTTVIPDQTREVYNVATDPKKLLEFEGMDHFYKKDKKMLKKVNENIVKYIEENI